MRDCSINELTVDPALLGLSPGVDLLLVEPESNLLLGAVNGIGAVADVAADVLDLISIFSGKRSHETYNGKVATDGARLRVDGLGGAKQLAAHLDRLGALPYHGADRSAGHVGYKTLEEGLAGEVLVVLLEVLLSGSGELDGNELEAGPCQSMAFE